MSKVAVAAVALTSLKLDAIQAAVAAKECTKADAAAELTRRIDQRAAAGKHPMPFVIAARDALLVTKAPVRRVRAVEAAQAELV
jgi:hypothetical protein